MIEMLKTRKEQLEAQGQKGFTLMEMLIVIAIIAVLIAIAIPILSAQLENAREATDAANIRSAYATASVKALEDNTSITAGPVTMTQQTSGWASAVQNDKIGTVTVSSIPSSGNVYVHVNADGTMSIDANAGSGTVVDPINGN